ncbi:MAG: hypothetical protein GPJ18_02220 [Microcystis aeruginosa F13-15]|nr:hypothetical protein [Microcystis aeruginosa F13-15]
MKPTLAQFLGNLTSRFPDWANFWPTFRTGEMAAGFLPSIDSEQNHISTYLGRLTCLDAPLDAGAQIE